VGCTIAGVRVTWGGLVVIYNDGTRVLRVGLEVVIIMVAGDNVGCILVGLSVWSGRFVGVRVFKVGVAVGRGLTVGLLLIVGTRVGRSVGLSVFLVGAAVGNLTGFLVGGLVGFLVGLAVSIL